MTRLVVLDMNEFDRQVSKAFIKDFINCEVYRETPDRIEFVNGTMVSFYIVREGSNQLRGVRADYVINNVQDDHFNRYVARPMANHGKYVTFESK